MMGGAAKMLPNNDEYHEKIAELEGDIEQYKMMTKNKKGNLNSYDW